MFVVMLNKSKHPLLGSLCDCEFLAQKTSYDLVF